MHFDNKRYIENAQSTNVQTAQRSMYRMSHSHGHGCWKKDFMNIASEVIELMAHIQKNDATPQWKRGHYLPGCSIFPDPEHLQALLKGEASLRED